MFLVRRYNSFSPYAACTSQSSSNKSTSIRGFTFCTSTRVDRQTERMVRKAEEPSVTVLHPSRRFDRGSGPIDHSEYDSLEPGLGFAQLRRQSRGFLSRSGLSAPGPPLEKHQENPSFTFPCFSCFFMLFLVRKVLSLKSTDYL